MEVVIVIVVVVVAAVAAAAIVVMKHQKPWWNQLKLFIVYLECVYHVKDFVYTGDAGNKQLLLMTLKHGTAQSVSQTTYKPTIKTSNSQST